MASECKNDPDFEHEKLLFKLVHDEGQDIFKDILADWYFNPTPSDSRITDGFIVFVFKTVSEGFCGDYLNAVISVLESETWNWNTLVEYTFEYHPGYTGIAAEDAWRTCFPEWTGKDLNSDKVVDVNDVMMLLDPIVCIAGEKPEGLDDILEELEKTECSDLI